MNPDDLFRRPADQEVRRDQWDRPLIVTPDGLGERPYTRTSTLAKALDDGTALGNWKARMACKGVSTNPDLAASFAALDLDDKADKKRAGELIEMAMERAGSSRRRELGTALHRYTELHDLGKDIPNIHPEIAGAFHAYVEATRHIEWVGVEQFVINDQLESAGTADRFGFWKMGDGSVRVFDVKTSGNVQYGALSFAMQLAVYANGVLYDPRTYARTPLAEAFGRPIDLDVGTIIHVDPYPEEGKRHVHLYDVDLRMGMRAASAGKFVREWRKYKMPADLIAEILAAQSKAELNEIFDRTKSRWTEHEKRAATLRAKELSA